MENEQNQIASIYVSPFFALAMIFEKNPQVEQIMFSAYRPAHFTHSPHQAFGTWRRGQPPFVGDNIFVHRLGKTVLYDLLGARQILEGRTLTPDWQEKVSLIWESLEKSMEDVFLGACSKVLLKDGTYAHIPMIDFSSQLTGGLDDVKTALKRIGEEEGYIYNSGRSFHYYGAKVLNPREWQIFYGKTLLLNTREEKVSDDRYVGHRLIDDFGCLRISRNSQKPHYPRLVAIYRAQDIDYVEPIVGDEERLGMHDQFFEGEAQLYRNVQRGEPLIGFDSFDI